MRRKRPGTVSDGAYCPCMIIPTLLAKLEFLRKYKWEVWSHSPYSPDSAPNLYSKHLSGTRFFSESDVKTVVENWHKGQDVISA
ncbi:hypothetical protein AVEN_244769-1 [Araneus ventricosus]|uniref:Histone-lysine N-methyltransferase SETMAR n=1 Tax=Araneus ventricosus TaxID=182803 RepID=A0A4Y2BRG8_ARAVE|nr:hypothetical protein AVEN_244769-1 [Araneus ventricosus]